MKKLLVGIAGVTNTSKYQKDVTILEQLVHYYISEYQLECNQYQLTLPIRKTLSDLFNIPIAYFYLPILKKCFHYNIRDMNIKHINDIDPDLINNTDPIDVTDGKYISIKRLMSWYAQDVLKKHINDKLLINKFESWFHKVPTEVPTMNIVDDIKFANEAQAVIDNGGIVINIQNPKNQTKRDIDEMKNVYHISYASNQILLLKITKIINQYAGFKNSSR